MGDANNAVDLNPLRALFSLNVVRMLFSLCNFMQNQATESSTDILCLPLTVNGETRSAYNTWCAMLIARFHRRPNSLVVPVLVRDHYARRIIRSVWLHAGFEGQCDCTFCCEQGYEPAEPVDI